MGIFFKPLRQSVYALRATPDTRFCKTALKRGLAKAVVGITQSHSVL